MCPSKNYSHIVSESWCIRRCHSKPFLYILLQPICLLEFFLQKTLFPSVLWGNLFQLKNTSVFIRLTPEAPKMCIKTYSPHCSFPSTLFIDVLNMKKYKESKHKRKHVQPLKYSTEYIFYSNRCELSHTVQLQINTSLTLY